MDCIIIEDQAPAQRVLIRYITDMDHLTLKGTFSDAIEAMKFLKHSSVDLIFLDIHLPKISGIDFLNALPNPPAIIMTTAFSDYAVQSYELEVVDYLVKPFSFERFEKAVHRAGKGRSELIESKSVVSDHQVFFIKSGYDYIKVSSEEVLYIHSDMDYTELYLPDQMLLSSETLLYWEKKLDAQQFVRVHKSYLVNLAPIIKVSGNQVYLPGGICIPIGRAYKESFVSRYLN